MKQLSGFLIVGTVLFSACKSSETTPSDRVSVSLHQSARLGADIVVRADSIQDSRCPTGVTCIWAGEAKVKLLLSNGKDSSTVRLTVGASLNSKRLDSTNVSLTNSVYKVILREVNPYPTATPSSQPQTAVVQVTKI
ncbi:hypothetical protein ACFS25_05300 [Spirosoma flavum]|uniref:Lipoprotein n=2 Tax=Spirosoma flavum TaxID=2048557 RepID=A0ABW6AGI0_9BACT